MSIMRRHDQISLQRTSSCSKSTSSCSKSTKKILPSNNELSGKVLLRRDSPAPVSLQFLNKAHAGVSNFINSLLNLISFPACKWRLTIPTAGHLSITPPIGRKVSGTLFGHRRGHVNFAVQYDTRAEPVLLLELAMSTATLVKEMASGLVRIALECEKVQPAAPTYDAARGKGGRRLFQEPSWTMYCNGKKCGYAVSRTCGESDWHVLNTVQRVSVGAGVIPVVDDGRKGCGGSSEGELLYMRARFERVVGSRDSEAFYMMNPDNTGGPELSIFLLRI